MDADTPRRRSRLTGGAWAQVVAAAGFLTRLPAGSSGKAATTGAAAFGLIGALLGAAAGLVLVAAAPVAPLAAGLLAIALLAAASGALHLDGLADTADALAVGDPARAETARRDPRLGAAGVVAIVVVIGLDAALLAALVTARSAGFAALACIVAATGSRALATALPMIARERIRPASTAAWFAAHTSPGVASTALTTAAAVAVIAQFVAGSAVLPVGLVVGLASSTVAAEWLIRRRGALDGDGIGAIVELAFAAILLATAIASAVAASRGL
jgi:adenosylcobinamide-GDP ribazoletransferase